MNWHFLINTWSNWALSIKILLSKLKVLTSFFHQQIPCWCFHHNAKRLQTKFWTWLLFLRKHIHCLVPVYLGFTLRKDACASSFLNLSAFRETNLVLQLIKESQIKSKTVMSWISLKKKEDIFCTVYFVWGNFFNICVLLQCIVYWINFQKIQTSTYEKTLLHTLFSFFLKCSKAFGASLNLLKLF